MNSHIFTHIQSLPPLNETAKKLQQISSSEHFEPESIAKVIEKDPMVLAELLKTLNSAAFSFKQDIKSVKQAVMMLGFKPLKNLVTQITARKALDTDLEPYGITTKKFSEATVLQSQLVKKWHPGEEDADLLQLSALLQEIGMFLIANEVIKNNETSQFLSDLDMSYDLERTEKDYTGTTAALVSAKILEHWEFDETLVNLLEESASPGSNASWILKISRVAISPRFPLTERSINKAVNLAEKLNLDPEALREALESLQ